MFALALLQGRGVRANWLTSVRCCVCAGPRCVSAREFVPCLPCSTGFRDTVMRMLALDPSERVTAGEALLCFEALPLPPQLDLSDDEGPAESDSETAAPGAHLSLTVRYVSGQTTTLMVDPGATVSAVLQRCLSSLFPLRYQTTFLSTAICCLCCSGLLLHKLCRCLCCERVCVRRVWTCVRVCECVRVCVCACGCVCLCL